MAASGTRGRWFATSVGLHALAVVAALVVPARLIDAPKPPKAVDVVIYRPAPPAPQPVQLPRPPKPEVVAELPRPEPKRPEPPARRVEKPKPATVPEPPIQEAIEPVVEITRVAAEPTPAPPVERRVVREPGPAFTPPATPKTASKSKAVARTGAFGSVQAAETSMARPDVKVAALGGFAPAEAEERRPPTRAAGVVVLDASFGTEVVEAASRPRASGSVGTAGFGAAVDAEPRAPARKRDAETLDTPVEILSKPLPVYTDEARRLRVEGEVVLEVLFVAGGELSVVRVVRGLGHGLDEAAIAAAKKIEFKPARRDGRPVDHTAQLRVVFRLA